MYYGNKYYSKLLYSNAQKENLHLTNDPICGQIFSLFFQNDSYRLINLGINIKFHFKIFIQ